MEAELTHEEQNSSQNRQGEVFARLYDTRHFLSFPSRVFVDRASDCPFPTVSAVAPSVDLDLDDSWN